MADEAERLGDLLEKAVVRPARRSRSLIQRARRKWEEAAGSDTSAHSWPRSMRRGVLTVEVDSSALLAQMAGYRKSEILHALARGKDALGVRDIKFVLAEVKE